MKIIVIGLGSMGRRRIRLLQEKANIALFGIDSNTERAKQVSEMHQITCYSSIAEVVKAEHPDCAFVCTSPLSHANIINECLRNRMHVFTEINLVDDRYEENMKLAEENKVVLFLSSTFLYNEQTSSIIKKVQGQQAGLNYVYHVGQYLPDWHPWESFKDYFIGDKRTNGCREIMAIDFPWIITAFGTIKNVQCLKSKSTSLNISYNDNYLLMVEHETEAKGMFAVDVVSRKATRHFECFGENLHITWDGTPDSLYEYDLVEKKSVQVMPSESTEHIEGYAQFISENPYRREVEAFLDQVQNPSAEPGWDFKKDKTLLGIIDQIEA
ncbi:Gfo/Idh/MocA family oxidoreductase [Parabacteroides sp.]|uniref:Gfo/Idh/MocA family protein n=1 Tax=Parabacteroides sp. TaxID=1869337 RepID=UPI00257BCC5F|nr:Gfo/Idh/MocA family oxidoreductase [Parabacteroides sp.]